MEGFDLGDEDGDGKSGGLIGLGTQSGSAAPGNEAGQVAGVPGIGAGGSPVDDLSQEEIEQRTPDDVPTMVDDDIIARQLREAALVEEDPKLRERLWDEYRKYKGI
jgi:hypothetical protein